MANNPRQEQLLTLVNDKGYYTVDELSELLVVSTQTVRRDIKKLDEKSLVIRHHGGVSSSSTKTNLDYEIRKSSETEKKHAIAEKIADAIPDNSSVFISVGTTTEIIAKHLMKKNGLQVITNSFRVANILHENKNFNVLITGGNIKASNGGVSGTETINFLSKFRFDYLITSAGSIDLDGTMLEYDLLEAEVVQTAMASARRTLVALDSTKFIPKGSVELCNIREVSALYSDVKPPSSILSILNKSSVDFIKC